MAYVEVKEYGELQPGDQIARMGLLKNLHPTLKALRVVVSGSKYYFHHGIYMGHLKVVHFHGETKSDAIPRQVDLKMFDNGVDRKLFRVDYEGVETFPPDETIRKAKELVSNSDDESKWPKFDFISNNCETMATYLKTGKRLSIQASEALCRSASVIEGSLVAACSVGAVCIGASLASGAGPPN